MKSGGSVVLRAAVAVLGVLLLALIVSESIRATAGESAGRAFLAPLPGLGGVAVQAAGKSAGDRIKGIFRDLGR